MMELKDGFIRELDNEKNGIQGRLKSFGEILKAVEPHVDYNIQ